MVLSTMGLAQAASQVLLVSPWHYPPSCWPAQSQGGVKVSPASACDRELHECKSQHKDFYIPSSFESIGKGHSKDTVKAEDVHA